MSFVIRENHATMYQSFDTKGLPGGQYKVEIRFSGSEEGKLSSDSVTLQVPELIDRSGDITITSPMSQMLNEALRIEGSVTKLGNKGIEIDLPTANALEISSFSSSFSTEDQKEGMTAFLEKRKPLFKGDENIK